MPGAGNKDAVYGVERGVGLCCYDVVFGKGEAGGGREVWEGEGVCCGVQESREDTPVTTIFRTSTVERGITFENGDAEGEVWHVGSEG